MDNARFLFILNRAVRQSGLDLTAPASPSDPAAVAAWAGLLRRCVADGVSIADPRWRDLEVRSTGGSSQLVLGSEEDESGDGEADFTLGLSLLMSMLGGRRDTDG